MCLHKLDLLEIVTFCFIADKRKKHIIKETYYFLCPGLLITTNTSGH